MSFDFCVVDPGVRVDVNGISVASVDLVAPECIRWEYRSAVYAQMSAMMRTAAWHQAWWLSVFCAVEVSSRRCVVMW